VNAQLANHYYGAKLEEEKEQEREPTWQTMKIFTPLLAWSYVCSRDLDCVTRRAIVVERRVAKNDQNVAGRQISDDDVTASCDDALAGRCDRHKILLDGSMRGDDGPLEKLTIRWNHAGEVGIPHLGGTHIGCEPAQHGISEEVVLVDVCLLDWLNGKWLFAARDAFNRWVQGEG
jgi:hypothetical protein